MISNPSSAKQWILQMQLAVTSREKYWNNIQTHACTVCLTVPTDEKSLNHIGDVDEYALRVGREERFVGRAKTPARSNSAKKSSCFSHPAPTFPAKMYKFVPKCSNSRQNVQICAKEHKILALTSKML